MLIESVFECAKPLLLGKKIKDAVIGISLLAVELEGGHIGVSYVLREDLAAGCSAFPYAGDMVGQKAEDVALWALTGQDSLQKGIGVAALTAASNLLDLKDEDEKGRPFGITTKPTDTVGMIGLISPIVKMLGPKVRKVLVFDKGISESGGGTDVLPMEEQPSALPNCDIVFITGTTMINGTLEPLLKMCECAREVVLVGPSTPMFPRAFLGTDVTVLAGSWWKPAYKDRIWRSISLACGNQDLGFGVVKKNVRVRP